MSCGGIVVRAHLSDSVFLYFCSVYPSMSLRHNAAGALHIAYREVKQISILFEFTVALN